jgi:hypothetical protein
MYLKLSAMSKNFLSKRFISILSALFAPFIITIILSVFPSTRLNAQGGNLVIIPRRVIFEGSAKTQEITLANGGTETATYNISLVQMRMKEDGSFEEITTPDSGQYFADKYLRFYPRSVKLAPKESQMIKMQLIKADKLAPGEYRSHIYFRAEPESIALGEKGAPKDTTTFSATLKAVFGITIPVIIRVGDPTGTVTFSDLSVDLVNDTMVKCKMSFNRSGNSSVYGDLVINYISPQGKITQVANPKGIAVYTPNSLRRFDCKLENAAGVNYHNGKLQLLFSTQLGSRPIKLAEGEIKLQ